MIEPTRYGAQLVQAIEADIAPATAAIWPLGQAGVIVRYPAATVAVDLYLSNHCEAAVPRPFDHRRLTRSPLDPSEIVTLDAILCTHFHLDHFDVPTIRTLRDASPDALLVLPMATRPEALSLDWPEDRVRGTRGSETVEIGRISVTAFGVPHDEYEEDLVTGHLFQGFAISDGDVTIAHVGDSRSSTALIERLASIGPDLICLPINGRSPKRALMGFAGNMNAEEAVELAVAAGIPRVLPMHEDMFAQNIDIDARIRFMSAAARAGVEVVRPAVGDAYVLHSNHPPRDQNGFDR